MLEFLYIVTVDIYLEPKLWLNRAKNGFPTSKEIINMYHILVSCTIFKCPLANPCESCDHKLWMRYYAIFFRSNDVMIYIRFHSFHKQRIKLLPVIWNKPRFKSNIKQYLPRYTLARGRWEGKGGSNLIRNPLFYYSHETQSKIRNFL